MPNTQELDQDMLSDIRLAAQHCQSELGSLHHDAAPAAWLARLDREVCKILEQLDTVAKSGSGTTSHANDEATEQLLFEYGCLWGELLVRGLGWQWVQVQFDQGLNAVGVASVDRSLVIYPFHALAFYQDQTLPVRIHRSFEVLTEPGRVPMLPPHGLENVLEHID